MAYTKKTWVTGETIEASELNHMEDGIVEAAQSGGATTLNGLTDVSLGSPQNGQVLTYDGTNAKWKNLPPSGNYEDVINASDNTLLNQKAGALYDYVKTHFVCIQPQAITGLIGMPKLYPGMYPLTNAYQKTNTYYFAFGIYVFSGTSNDYPTYTEVCPELANVGNVKISSPTNGQVLTYDSTSSKWKNADSSGASTLASLTDTDIRGTLYNGAILRYNSSAQKWRNTLLELASVATEGEDGVLYIGGNAESPGNYVNTITLSGMLVLMLYDAVSGDLASVTPFTGAVYNQDGTITYKFGNITYTSDLNDDLMYRDS